MRKPQMHEVLNRNMGGQVSVYGAPSGVDGSMKRGYHLVSQQVDLGFGDFIDPPIGASEAAHFVSLRHPVAHSMSPSCLSFVAGKAYLTHCLPEFVFVGQADLTGCRRGV